MKGFKWFANAKLLIAALKIIRDPSRLDDALAISDRVSADAVIPVTDFFLSNEETRAAFKTRPVAIETDINRLREYPSGSLGKEYGDLLHECGIDPKDIKSRHGLRQSDHRYVVDHLYSSHDIWHVVTGFKTDVAGELGLQAFYAAQSPMRFPIIIIGLGMLNAFFYQPADAKRRLEAICKGYQLGKKSKQLFGIDWQEKLQQPLSSVRAELKLA